MKSILIILLVVASLFYATAQTSEPRQTTHLRVILFNYIPDAANDHFASLSRRIKDEFEKLHPDIQLELRPLFADNDKFDLYGTSPQTENSVANFLSLPVENGGYDMAEVDTVILGDLIENDVLRQWTQPLSRADWHPAAARAVTVGSEIFGVPHWLCGHFIFSRNKEIALARTSSNLAHALNKSTTVSPKLVGRLTGSWNVPSLYLDAYADNYGSQNLQAAVSTHLDSDTLSNLQIFSKECRINTQNPCLNKDYDDPDIPTAVFAKGDAVALFGYSERLNLIRRKAPKDKFFLSSAPIGEGNHPIVFTDAFVIRKDCNHMCEIAARSFVEYMNSPKTQEWILMARDAGENAIPRYLIPATLSAFKTPGVAGDIYYRRIQSEIQAADPFPSFWFSKIHSKMRDLIVTRLAQ